MEDSIKCLKSTSKYKIIAVITQNLVDNGLRFSLVLLV